MDASNTKFTVNASLTGSQLTLLNTLLFPRNGKISGEELNDRKKLWKELILPAEQESGLTFESDAS